MSKKLEIYYTDFTNEVQDEILEFYGVEDYRELNFDTQPVDPVRYGRIAENQIPGNPGETLRMCGAWWGMIQDSTVRYLSTFSNLPQN